MTEEKLKETVLKALEMAKKWPNSQSIFKAQGALIAVIKQYLFDGRLHEDFQIEDGIKKMPLAIFPKLHLCRQKGRVFSAIDYQAAIEAVIGCVRVGMLRRHLGKKDKVTEAEMERIANMLEGEYQKSKKPSDKGKKIDAYCEIKNKDNDPACNFSREKLRKYWKTYYPKRFMG